MSNVVAIYSVSQKMLAKPHVRFALEALSIECDRLILVTSAEEDEVQTQHPDIAIETVLTNPSVDRAAISGIGLALKWLTDNSPDVSSRIVTMTADVLGPIGGLRAHLDIAQADGADVYCAYWRATDLDPALKNKQWPDRIPYLDFMILSAEFVPAQTACALWASVLEAEVDLNGVSPYQVDLAKAADVSDTKISYPPNSTQWRSSDPRYFEIGSIVRDGSPVIPLSVFFVDPLLHDMHTIDIKVGLDHLRQADPSAYECAISYALEMVPLRDFSMIADEYAIHADVPEHPEKTAWSFGTVAVFLHAYYTDMLPNFVELLDRIPAPTHLFISTATSEAADEIRLFLKSTKIKEENATIRVVEHNRGRDMSSLFITWRDIVISGKYEIALRLHSKRTPQVPAQIGESFKAHLFDNLIGSRGYVSNVLDQLETQRDIGLITPPLIHIGFATLGHSWFNNKHNVSSLANDIGLDVPMDKACPVAPYGTMFWFRTSALKPMFAHDWKWEDYNKEPHHIDGGLAHAQERLIGYCAQAQGFRVLQVMSTEQAARNYAKIEYKLQRLASHLPLGNVVEQDRLLSSNRGGAGDWLFVRLRKVYGEMLVRWPSSRQYLRPFAHWIAKQFAPAPRFKKHRDSPD
ncbi:rhamnan synthesis F family protein [Pseudophaeobacter sp.]|uniref:rhamnan synthesis F family protein n=1 Tax=Pseudophaeobacter sp. TaxID=1971739 RepID=UPI0032969A17